MASGGFHGGSTHSGSFHSSGGGGFSGGGGGSGGSFHSSGGGYSGGGGSSSSTWLIFAWGPMFMIMMATFDDPIIWGFNYLSTFIFWISGIVLYIVYRQSERTQVIAEIKRDCHHRILGYVWHGDAPSAKKDTDNKTWAGTPYSYRIVFYDKAKFLSSSQQFYLFKVIAYLFLKDDSVYFVRLDKIKRYILLII